MTTNEQYRQIIQELELELMDLEKEAKKIRDSIDFLVSRIQSRANAVEAERKVLNKYVNISCSDAILKILSNTPFGLSSGMIVDHLLKNGYDSETKDLNRDVVNNLNTLLDKNKVEKIGELWRLVKTNQEDLTRKSIEQFVPKEKKVKQFQLREDTQMAQIRDILKEAGKPLHVEKIGALIGIKDVMKQRNLASPLTQYAKKGRVFARHGKNTFGLKDYK